MRARRKARRDGLDSGVSVEALSITGLDVTATCVNGPCHANDVEEAMKASDAIAFNALVTMIYYDVVDWSIIDNTTSTSDREVGGGKKEEELGGVLC